MQNKQKNMKPSSAFNHSLQPQQQQQQQVSGTIITQGSRQTDTGQPQQ
jgi:hypothetical protein